MALADCKPMTIDTCVGVKDNLLIDSKLAILDSLAKGISQAGLAEECGVGKSTITQVKKNEKFREYAWGCDIHIKVCAHLEDHATS